ncbi:MAG: DUF3299 domain-containing protein [Planctomycetota bacterium]|nr:DUF3299 domain-containing protein [Planctomycetota bacterium]
MTEQSTFSESEPEVYQSVSRAAVASALLGLFGLGAFFFSTLVVLSLIGVVFAALGLSAIRKFPNEIQGDSIAWVGGIVCLSTLILAPSYHVFVYMTEVPEGYERLDFAVLMSDESAADRPPSNALDFNGKQVFIKGYIHPTSMTGSTAKKFVLVPDLGTCCFGGQPPLTHMIEVNLTGDQYARKGFRKQRLAGTLRVNNYKKPVDGLDGVFYQLRADILK